MTVQMNRKRWLLLTIAACAALFLAVEAYRAISFYEDLSTGRDALLSLKADLDLDNLEDSEAQLLTKRRLLQDAQRRLSSAQTFVATDPLLALAARLPLVGKQTDALSKLVVAANEATHTGLVASDVALAFARYEPDPSKTSIEEALTFLLSQEDAMADVQGRLAKLERLSADIPGGLLGPLESGRLELDAALEKLASLVDGYDRAHALLPELFGLYGPPSLSDPAPKRHRALPIRRPDLQLRHRRPRPGPARVDGARVLRHLVRPLAAAERRRIRGAAASAAELPETRLLLGPGRGGLVPRLSDDGSALPQLRDEGRRAAHRRYDRHRPEVHRRPAGAPRSRQRAGLRRDRYRRERQRVDAGADPQRELRSRRAAQGLPFSSRSRPPGSYPGGAARALGRPPAPARPHGAGAAPSASLSRRGSAGRQPPVRSRRRLDRGGWRRLSPGRGHERQQHKAQPDHATAGHTGTSSCWRTAAPAARLPTG